MRIWMMKVMKVEYIGITSFVFPFRGETGLGVCAVI